MEEKPSYAVQLIFWPEEWTGWAEETPFWAKQVPATWRAGQNENFYEVKLTSRYFLPSKQTQSGFDVDNFSKTHGLLKFAFVRHPFDRYVWDFRLLSFWKWKSKKHSDVL